MNEEDDFDMLLGDDDVDLSAASLSDQATGLKQCTGPELGETVVENGGRAIGIDDDGGDSKDGGAREWTAEEVKLVEPCIKLIEVSDD
jgi:hypothetical protein